MATALVSLCVCVLSLVAAHWGHVGASKPGGLVSPRVYAFASMAGPALAIVSGLLAAALYEAGAP